MIWGDNAGTVLTVPRVAQSSTDPIACPKLEVPWE